MTHKVFLIYNIREVCISVMNKTYSCVAGRVMCSKNRSLYFWIQPNGFLRLCAYVSVLKVTIHSFTCFVSFNFLFTFPF